MEKTIIKGLILGVITLVFACGGSDGPPPNGAPSTVDLVYPTVNLLCIDNTIPFDWSEATDPDQDVLRYKITIAKDRALTDIVEERTLSATNVSITLQKGFAHYWKVTAIDSENNEGTPSATQAFYTAGNGVTNYAPFAAALVSPNDDGNVNPGAISLSWTGSDIDTEDELVYDLYFGETEAPPLVTENVTAETFEVTVDSGKTYYWKVNTSDGSGAKTIGQVWKFSVN